MAPKGPIQYQFGFFEFRLLLPLLGQPLPLYTGTVLEKGCTKPNITMPVEVHMVFKPSPQT